MAEPKTGTMEPEDVPQHPTRGISEDDDRVRQTDGACRIEDSVVVAISGKEADEEADSNPVLVDKHKPISATVEQFPSLADLEVKELLYERGGQELKQQQSATTGRIDAAARIVDEKHHPARDPFPPVARPYCPPGMRFDTVEETEGTAEERSHDGSCSDESTALPREDDWLQRAIEESQRIQTKSDLDLEQALQESANEVVECESCERPVSIASYAFHLPDCFGLSATPDPSGSENLTGIPCEYCGDALKVEDYDEHVATCPAFHSIPCEWCGEQIPVSKYAVHLEQCESRQLPSGSTAEVRREPGSSSEAPFDSRQLPSSSTAEVRKEPGSSSEAQFDRQDAPTLSDTAPTLTSVDDYDFTTCPAFYSIPCEWCGEQIPVSKYAVHLEQCGSGQLPSSSTAEVRQEPGSSSAAQFNHPEAPTLSDTAPILRAAGDYDEGVATWPARYSIPCEWCGEQLPVSKYTVHLEHCESGQLPRSSTAKVPQEPGSSSEAQFDHQQPLNLSDTAPILRSKAAPTRIEPMSDCSRCGRSIPSRRMFEHVRLLHGGQENPPRRSDTRRRTGIATKVSNQGQANHEFLSGRRPQNMAIIDGLSVSSDLKPGSRFSALAITTASDFYRKRDYFTIAFVPRMAPNSLSADEKRDLSKMISSGKVCLPDDTRATKTSRRAFHRFILQYALSYPQATLVSNETFVDHLGKEWSDKRREALYDLLMKNRQCFQWDLTTSPPLFKPKLASNEELEQALGPPPGQRNLYGGAEIVQVSGDDQPPPAVSQEVDF